MKDDIVIPPGLIRTRTAWVLVAIGCVVSSVSGYAAGHSRAQVVTRIDRVEVPYPDVCVDEMFRLEDDDRRDHIKCSHPEQHGTFESVAFPESFKTSKPYLVCRCTHPQLTLPEAGAR